MSDTMISTAVENTMKANTTIRVVDADGTTRDLTIPPDGMRFASADDFKAFRENPTVQVLYKAGHLRTVIAES